MPEAFDVEYPQDNPEFDARLEMLCSISNQLEECIWSDIEPLFEFIAANIALEMKSEGKTTDSSLPPPRFRTLQDLVGRKVSEADLDHRYDITRTIYNQGYQLNIEFEAMSFNDPEVWQCDHIEVEVMIDKNGILRDAVEKCRNSSFSSAWDVDIGTRQMNELADLVEHVLGIRA